MRLKALLAVASAASLIATPALASSATNPAASLSVAKAASARAGTPTGKSSRLANGAILPIILGLAIIGGGIYIAVDDNDDHPDSN